MSAYYVTLPIVPWWYVLAVVVGSFVFLAGAALTVGWLLGRHRPRTYARYMLVAVLGLTCAVAGVMVLARQASTAPVTPGTAQEVIDSSWTSLGDARVDGQDVVTDGAQECRWISWAGSGAQYLAVVCDGDLVPWTD